MEHLLIEKKRKRNRKETDEKKVKEKTETHPGKRNISLQKDSHSADIKSELSYSFLMSDPPEPQAEDLPERFSESYIIGELLGKGGYASIYAGVRKSDGEKVAIKYISKDTEEYFTPPGESCSLPLEVVATEFVNKPHSSPNVIKMLEWFETPNGFLLILERPLNYITLYEFHRSLQGRMSEDMARTIMWNVIKAVIHCWKCAVVHRDIKEENILVNPETLELKLIDFGYSFLVRNRPYTAFGGLPVSLPARWIVEKSTWAEPATVWDLGALFYTLICGERFLHSRPKFSINGVSEACCSLMNLCLKGDLKKRPKLKQIFHHHWFQDRTVQQT